MENIRILVGLILAVAMGAIALALLIPAITGTQDAASCTGLMRGIGSIIADMTGRSIC